MTKDNKVHIVEEIDDTTKAVVYNVECGAKTLYSTVSKPLAYAFLQGLNIDGNWEKDLPGNASDTADKTDDHSSDDTSDDKPDNKGDNKSSFTPKAQPPRKRAML